MRTKTQSSVQRSLDDVHRILDRPSELVLDDAEVYWLEDRVGNRLGPESERSLAPISLALKLARDGFDPEDLMLLVRLDNGDRFELGGGPSLISVAEHAAGVPRRPGVPKRA